MKKNFCLFFVIGLSFLFLSFQFYPIKTENKRDKSGITVATWNIGYFSNGVSGLSYIKTADYKMKLKEYRSIIYDSIHADIISINEYNRVFTGKDNENNKYVTSSLLFNQFDEKVMGPRKGIRKALFSKHKLNRTRFKYLEGHKRVIGNDSVKMRHSYYIASDITLGGKNVKLVCVHLLFSRMNPGVVQTYQIEELIKKYRKYDRVIMCGDWNTSNYSQLKKAGYTLANDGSLITYPSKKTPLDNIAVKGVRLSDVRVIKTKLSDHYPIVCRITIK